MTTTPITPVTNFIRGTTAADPSWWWTQVYGLGPMLLLGALVLGAALAAAVSSN
jgi:hypothetical protein